MSFNLEVPQRFYEKLVKISGQIKAKYKKEHSQLSHLLKYESEIARDFCAECLDVLMGKSSSENQWAQGTIVMGKDKSYIRSHYEVLADNGQMVLMVLRRYQGKSGRITQPDKIEEAVIRRKDSFEVNSDHFLSPSQVEVELPANWVSDYKQIKIKPTNYFCRVKISPPEVYEDYAKPNHFKAFEENWISQRNKK